MEGWTIAELQTLVRVLAGAFIFMSLMLAAVVIRARILKEQLSEARYQERQLLQKMGGCHHCFGHGEVTLETDQPTQTL